MGRSSGVCCQTMCRWIYHTVDKGVFPNEIKLARVVPVYKGNNKQTISNYRPISILTFFSKVIETIMYNTIAKFLEIKDTMHDCQFGF